MSELNEKSIQRRVLPAAWVDRIFAVLLAHYGSRFVDMWRDTNISDVKAIWANKLGGFAGMPECIWYALNNLDGRDWPPTLPEFIGDCRKAPRKPMVALELKLSPEDVERNRSRAKQMVEQLGRRLAA